MEFLESITVKAGLNVFFYFPAWRYAKLLFNFDEFQPTYAYKCYADI